LTDGCSYLAVDEVLQMPLHDQRISEQCQMVKARYDDHSDPQPFDVLDQPLERVRQIGWVLDVDSAQSRSAQLRTPHQGSMHFCGLQPELSVDVSKGTRHRNILTLRIFGQQENRFLY
jgi:hypothetical protein